MQILASGCEIIHRLRGRWCPYLIPLYYVWSYMGVSWTKKNEGIHIEEEEYTEIRGLRDVAKFSMSSKIC